MVASKPTPVPDRVSANKKSPFYDSRCLSIGVKFNGIEQTEVIEYQISGGWIRRNKRGADGKYVTNMLGTGFAIERLNGEVEAYWRNEK